MDSGRVGSDVMSNLSVLHNQNKMVDLFRHSNWVTESQDQVVSRGVISCARYIVRWLKHVIARDNIWSDIVT